MGETTLKHKIQSDLKEAMKNRLTLAVSVLRLMLSEIHNHEIQTRKDAGDEDVFKVLTKAVKKHQDSITQFRSGGRTDLADKEQRELELIQSYLPPPLPEDELKRLVDETVRELQAAGERDLGKVISGVLAKTSGRVSGGQVSQLVKQALNLP